MTKFTSFFLSSILLLSCSEKVKYVDKEANVNVVPLPKDVNVIIPNKYIILPKEIQVFIDNNQKENLFNLISNDFKKLSYSNSFELVTNKNRSNLSIEIDDELDNEEYEINISNKVVIKGGSFSALKIARSTLLQL